MAYPMQNRYLDKARHAPLNGNFNLQDVLLTDKVDWRCFGGKYALDKLWTFEAVAFKRQWRSKMKHASTARTGSSSLPNFAIRLHVWCKSQIQ